MVSKEGTYYVRYCLVPRHHAISLWYRLVPLDMEIGIWMVPLDITSLYIPEEILVGGNLRLVLVWWC